MRTPRAWSSASRDMTRNTALDGLELFVSLVATVCTLNAMIARYRVVEPLLPVMVVITGMVVFLGLRLLRLGFIERKPRWVISGVAVFFLLYIIASSILHGTLWNPFPQAKKFNARSDVWYCALTVPSTICRQQSFETQMKHMGLRFEFFTGIIAKDYRTSKDIAEAFGMDDSALSDIQRKYKGHVASVTGTRLALSHIFKVHKGPWIALFDDDAKFLPGFVPKLELAMTAYQDYDMVWLDTRNALSWIFLNGRMVGGTAGMLYKTAVIPRIVEILHIDSPEYKAHMKNNRGEIGLQMDAFLANECNRGVFKCAFIPIVAEIPGQSSNVDWCAAKCVDPVKMMNHPDCTMCI